jgi:hypothetical protein
VIAADVCLPPTAHRAPAAAPMAEPGAVVHWRGHEPFDRQSLPAAGEIDETDCSVLNDQMRL